MDIWLHGRGKKKKYNNTYSLTEKEGNGTNSEIKPERARHQTLNRKGQMLCYIESKIRFYLIYFLFELEFLFLFSLFSLDRRNSRLPVVRGRWTKKMDG
jgi:hypothetical protein